MYVCCVVSLGWSDGRVEITLPKITNGKQWSSLGVAGQHDGAWIKSSAEGEEHFSVI